MKGRWKDQRDEKQFQTIRFVIDGVKIGGGAWYTRQKRGSSVAAFKDQN